MTKLCCCCWGLALNAPLSQKEKKREKKRKKERELASPRSPALALVYTHTHIYTYIHASRCSSSFSSFPPVFHFIGWLGICCCPLCYPKLGFFFFLFLFLPIYFIAWLVSPLCIPTRLYCCAYLLCALSLFLPSPFYAAVVSVAVLW